ncbi:SAG-related sequence [Besnoitia besnoiti]|uniref:SAG-related sequence n=1 Tax=Besnoitia besnoiti TaxID=94643 RepID=A0A2A9M856_BESBE|nr:SAG-related sequence [Besnoitia besnoiti]PFH31560.1 SAG-related sequence [Besnoitia besnoiti]
MTPTAQTGKPRHLQMRKEARYTTLEKPSATFSVLGERQRNMVTECPVTITVPEKTSPAPGPGAGEPQPESVVECTVGEGKDQQVTVSAKIQIVHIKCNPDTASSKPAEALQVFNNADGTCSQQRDLSALAPNGTRSQKSDKSVYTVAFPQLPSAAKSLGCRRESARQTGTSETQKCRTVSDVLAETHTSAAEPPTSDAASRRSGAYSWAAAGVLVSATTAARLAWKAPPRVPH